MTQDLKQYVASTTPTFDNADAASREAFQAVAAIVWLGTNRDDNLSRFADYLGWTVDEAAALSAKGVGYRTSPPATLRTLVAAGLDEQVEAYALFMVQITRTACLQFAAGDLGAARVASEIAATVTRFAPISNTRLEPPEPFVAQRETPVRTQVEPDIQAVGKALDDLERLVGLEDAKREINQQVQLIRITQMRERAGLKNPAVSRHLVFVGNPGTGKTTVARIVGRIYTALGLVADGHLVETDASGMVAGYVGQTAIKTMELITRAIGGILFIDEVYGLARNDFGLEAIDALVKGMEDNRQSLVVIVAGYSVNMPAFLDSNPGLESRFPTTIVFADFTPEELLRIFHRMCEDNDYALAEGATTRVLEMLAESAERSDFGNARGVRNLFEAALRQHAWRLKDVTEVSVDQMRTLTAQDLLAAGKG